MVRIALCIGALVTLSVVTACDRSPTAEDATPAAPTADNSASASASATDGGSLQAELDQRKASFEESAPEGLAATYDQGVRDVAESGVVDSAKQVGDQAPEFELPSANGEPVLLTELLESGPVVLVWYRGGWCPYCNIQLKAYQQRLDAFNEAGATIVAISPQDVEHTSETTQNLGVEFVMLSDLENAAASDYGLLYTLPDEITERLGDRLAAFNDGNRDQLPLAATYVVGSDGVIRYAHIQADYRVRAEPDDVLESVRQLQSDEG